MRRSGEWLAILNALLDKPNPLLKQATYADFKLLASDHRGATLELEC
jgi:hypothetical protein